MAFCMDILQARIRPVTQDKWLTRCDVKFLGMKRMLEGYVMLHFLMELLFLDQEILQLVYGSQMSKFATNYWIFD